MNGVMTVHPFDEKKIAPSTIRCSFAPDLIDGRHAMIQTNHAPLPGVVNLHV